MKKNVTIYDIAREAGVSPATVSRILTGTTAVSEEKRRRVKALIEKYHFRPNALARALTENRSRLLCMVVAHTGNSYYNSLFAACESEAYPRGYVTMLMNTHSRPDFEVSVLSRVREMCPDAMILCYPVITSGAYAHRESIVNLLGESYASMKEDVSLERFVREDTPPVFLWHTREDGCVPVENSLLLAEALCRKGVDFELHIWQHGEHGLSLSSDQVYPAGAESIRPECREWIEMAARWLRAI